MARSEKLHQVLCFAGGILLLSAVGVSIVWSNPPPARLESPERPSWPQQPHARRSAIETAPTSEES